MPHTRLLLLLTLLCAAELALHLYNTASIFRCPSVALAEAQRGRREENAILDKHGSDTPWPEEASEEEEEGEDAADGEMWKRTFPGEGHYKYVSQAQGKTYENRAKSDRRTMVTLSPDVPTNIMNTLFNMARAQLQDETAGGLELDDLKGPFQPKASYDSVISWPQSLHVAGKVLSHILGKAMLNLSKPKKLHTAWVYRYKSFRAP
ncbi:LOW QUALITY PROTEIN: urocortin-3-like [Podargus strigoides]